LYYHVLNGSHDNITDYIPVPTLLTSSDYTNVTGGQVVFAYFDDDENVLGFYSGLDIAPEAPKPPIAFSGGVIYILDNVLNIPVSVLKTVVGDEFNGTSFVDALNATGLAEEVELLHNSTFFVPVNDGFESAHAFLSNLTSEELAEVLKTIGYYDTLEMAPPLPPCKARSLPSSSPMRTTCSSTALGLCTPILSSPTASLTSLTTCSIRTPPSFLPSTAPKTVYRRSETALRLLRVLLPAVPARVEVAGQQQLALLPPAVLMQVELAERQPPVLRPPVVLLWLLLP
jgi:hypothetical protein